MEETPGEKPQLTSLLPPWGLSARGARPMRPCLESAQSEGRAAPREERGGRQDSRGSLRHRGSPHRALSQALGTGEDSEEVTPKRTRRTQGERQWVVSVLLLGSSSWIPCKYGNPGLHGSCCHTAPCGLLSFASQPPTYLPTFSAAASLSTHPVGDSRTFQCLQFPRPDPSRPLRPSRPRRREAPIAL